MPLFKYAFAKDPASQVSAYQLTGFCCLSGCFFAAERCFSASFLVGALYPTVRQIGIELSSGLALQGCSCDRHPQRAMGRFAGRPISSTLSIRPQPAYGQADAGMTIVSDQAGPVKPDVR